MERPDEVVSVGQLPVDDVVGEPLPVGLRIGETLRPSREVFGPGTNKAAIVFSDSGPFLEGFDVGNDAHGEHPAGNLI